MRNDGGVDLRGLPEGCVADILSLTSPQDACRLSLVSTLFRSAAESDAVWERFLPADYHAIIARSDGCSSTSFDLKKQLYLRLCDTPLLIDKGLKSFSLDKWSGKKCYMIAARDLSIIWGDTPSYWTWISLPESRFAEVAELRSVCWLEIRGKINTCMLSSGATYAAYIVFKITPQAYGFDYHTAEVSVEIVGGEERGVRTVYLDPNGGQTRQYPSHRRLGGVFRRGFHPFYAQAQAQAPGQGERDGRYPKERGDGWLEIELGEYFNNGGHHQELEMSLVEAKGGNWKSGLIVQGIEIRPKEGK